MFSNTALDVCIGLIFIYLLYSLLASILLEMVAQTFSLRARILLRALRRMLEDDVAHENPGVLAWIYELANDFIYFFRPFQGSSLLKRFYQHPTIRYLGENNARKKPAYLYPNTFSQTILQMLRGRGFNSQVDNESASIQNALKNNLLQVNPQTLQQLRDQFEDARQDTAQFRIQLENWFNETMDRANDWYKRQSQLLLLLIGFILAASFNIDTIAISQILIKDKTIRDQVAQLAISKRDFLAPVVINVSGPTSTTTAVTDTSARRTATPAGAVGDSTVADISENGQQVLNLLGLGNNPKIPKPAQPYIVLGWLLTALAISLGAPFWFDLLNKFIRIREMVPKSGTTTTQTTTDPNIIIKG